MKPSVLDTLKETLLRSEDLISSAQDSIAGSLCDTGHEDELEMIDAARKMLWEAVAAHVPGVRYEYPHYTDGGYTAAHTYDDGTPIVEQIELRAGHVASYYRRHDGDRQEFIDMLSTGLPPKLTIVD